MATLKLINDAGEVVYEFTESGYFGVIDNQFLIELASGKYDKSEIKASCYLMSTAGWSNKVDEDVTKGAKMIGLSYKAYSEVFRRLVEKNVLIEDSGAHYFNPEKFRRRTLKKKNPYKPWKKINADWQEASKEEGTDAG